MLKWFHLESPGQKGLGDATSYAWRPPGVHQRRGPRQENPSHAPQLNLTSEPVRFPIHSIKVFHLGSTALLLPCLPPCGTRHPAWPAAGLPSAIFGTALLRSSFLITAHNQLGWGLMGGAATFFFSPMQPNPSPRSATNAGSRENLPTHQLLCSLTAASACRWMTRYPRTMPAFRCTAHRHHISMEPCPHWQRRCKSMQGMQETWASHSTNAVCEQQDPMCKTMWCKNVQHMLLQLLHQVIPHSSFG